MSYVYQASLTEFCEGAGFPSLYLSPHHQRLKEAGGALAHTPSPSEFGGAPSLKEKRSFLFTSHTNGITFALRRVSSSVRLPAGTGIPMMMG